MVVGGVEVRHHVSCATSRAPGRRQLEHLGPVDDQPHAWGTCTSLNGATSVRIVIGTMLPPAAIEMFGAAALPRRGRRGRKEVGHVGPAGGQRVDLAGLVGVVRDDDPVEVRGAVEVVGVAQERALLPRRERLELERARAHRLLRVASPAGRRSRCSSGAFPPKCSRTACASAP